MHAVKQVAIFAENKTGQAANVTRILASAHINIRCVTISSMGAYGVMKVLVNEPELACQALKHEGFAATLMDVLAVEVADKPGALHRISDCLARSGINLDNTSGFVVNNRAILVLEVRDVSQGIEVLRKEGLRVLTQAETLAL